MKRRKKVRCQKKKTEEKPKRRKREVSNTTKLRGRNLNGCVPVVNDAEVDTSWLIMVTVSRVAIAV